MNSRQLHYAILLSKTLNFSQVAEKLNISQPALSKQILALENELGVKLFDRSSTPLKMTPAGEHFVAQAETLLYKENQLLRSMEQFRSGEAGTLTIGTTPFRSTFMLPDMLRQMREAFPNIQLRLIEEPSAALRQDAADGQFDFAIVNLPVDDSLLETIPLEPDQLVLVIPTAMKTELLPNVSDTVSFEECADIPFVVVSTTQEMRHLFDKMCIRANITPTIAVEAINLTTVWAVARAGGAATILPKQFVSNMPQDGLTVLNIENAPYIRQPVVAYRRDHVLTAAAKCAIRLLTGNEGF